MTSHLSDVYPPGLTIGRVKEIKNDTNGLTRYAIIEPAVDLKHLDTLLVIDKTNTRTVSPGDLSVPTDIPATQPETEEDPLTETDETQTTPSGDTPDEETQTNSNSEADTN